MELLKRAKRSIYIYNIHIFIKSKKNYEKK